MSKFKKWIKSQELNAVNPIRAKEVRDYHPIDYSKVANYRDEERPANYKGPSRGYAFGAPDQQQLIDHIANLEAKLDNPEYGSEDAKQAQLASLREELAGFGPSALEAQRQQDLERQARSNELIRIYKGGEAGNAPYNVEAEQQRLRQEEQAKAAEEARLQQAAQAKAAEEARVEQARLASRTWKGLSTEDLIKETHNLVNRDRNRNAALPQAIYQGQQVSPQSALTQKARDLQLQYNQKGAPYQNKINKVLSRQSQGLTPQHIGGLADAMEQGQQAFSKNKSFKALQKQFGMPVNAIESEFLNRTNKATSRERDLSKERMGVLGQKIGNAQGETNQTLVNLLEMLKGGKQQNRSAYINTANEFGGQQHAHKNMEIEANKQKFHEEANAPHKNLEMLAGTLAAQGINPANASPVELMQALQAYGIDPNKLLTEQQNPKRHQGYGGKRVAEMSPEMQASYDILERMNPKTTRSSVYPQQKEAIRELMDESNTIGDLATQNVPESIKHQIRDLEKRASKMTKEKVAGLNNKYIQNNQYGSAAHTQEARYIAEQVNKSLTQERAKMIEEALATQAQIAQGGTYNRMKNAAQLGNASHNEFMNTLQNVQGVNKIGNTKFNNNQDENDRIYHDYQMQNMHEWPHMRNAARIGGLNQVLPGEELNLKGRLNRYNTAYGEDKQNEQAYRQKEQEYNDLVQTGLALQKKNQQSGYK